MSDVRLNPNNDVQFVLKAPNRNSLFLNKEPDGWNEDELEIERNKDYHGIFTKITNKLIFYGDQRDYIHNAYILGGINTDLRLTKYITRDIENESGVKEVKFFERYSALADYSTMVIKNNGLEINFNSNDLAELLQSHEDDTFEIERKDSIDNVLLDDIEFNYIKIEGRDITGSGEQQISLFEYKQEPDGTKYQEVIIGDTGFVVCRTEIISQGTERHSPVNLRGEFPETNPTSGVATDAMFFIDDIIDSGIINLDFNFNFSVNIKRKEWNGGGTVECDLVKYRWNGTGYAEVTVESIVNIATVYTSWKSVNITGNRKIIGLKHDEGLMFRWRSSGTGKNIAKFYSFSINFTTIEFYESSPSIKYLFIHDVYERLLYILTGEKNRFYSKFFGRTELGYTQDGLDDKGNLGGGLIGVTSGFWIRQFNPLSEKYKSLQISLKDLNESNKAVFNIGVGIETVNLKERLRVEELKYFYQSRTVVKLPNQILNVKRSVDKKLFFSGTELGYSFGNSTDDDDIGLDEPNVKTNTVTPIRKSELKYSLTSKIRSDEYKFEKLRRKPQALYPDSDTNEDENNWYLDIVRDNSIVPIEFRQANWDDRLQKEPSGIHSPSTFRSMIFTPFRMLLRHGWIIRSGMEPYFNKFIKYVSSAKNSALSMLFIGETEEYKENSDILVSKLDRARFLPEIIEFEHDVDEDLMDLILGTTNILINGSYEDVPNFYFKIEYTNEYEEIERGYLISLKPKGNGKFKVIRANENLIYNG
jgi:hypothetical protein